MFLASKLRLMILEEPLLRPSQPSPLRLLVQEAMSNIRFDVYLLVLLAVVCLGLAFILLKRPRDEGNALLYTMGFLLIFCSYNLQKAIEINKMLSRSISHPDPAGNGWSWGKWLNPWGMRLGSSLGVNPGSHLLSSTGFLRASAKDGAAPQMASYMSSHEEGLEKPRVEDPALKEGVTKKNSSLVALTKKSPSHHGKENPRVRRHRPSIVIPSRGRQTPSDSMVEISRAPAIDVLARGGEKKEGVLRNLMKIFQFKMETDESLQRRVLALRATEIQVNKVLEEFVKVFKLFMKEAEKIESEMVAFNASTRYLGISLNDLKMEIRKCFSNLPEVGINREVPSYLSTLSRNYHGSEDTSGGDVSPIARYERYVVLFLMVQVVLCLFLFLAALAKVEAAISVLRPVVSISLMGMALASAVLLLSGQMLDRSCKSGSVKGCSFTPTLIDGVKRLEVVSRSDDLRTQLEAVVKESSQVAQTLGIYVKDMMDTRVNAKISVFSNLFNKVFFVYDDFDHLTGGKVDKDVFYGYIRMMSKLLENIAGLLDASGQKGMVDLYAGEKAFLFWLNADKDSVVESIRRITEAGPSHRSGMPSRWCVGALQSICDSKDEVDDMFVLALAGAPAFLLLLYL